MRSSPSCSSAAVACTTSEPPAPAVSPEMAAWQARAVGVTIVRDDWGIPHITAKTDADAVFGLMYAQAEDDFNRVETNFINAMGRLAEAEGEKEIYRDLRMKLFIDPAELRTMYAAAPAWLQAVMTGWADGLNYYLATHPDVKPRVITKFEPWMALSFSEGSIGGDIESVSIARLEAFYGRNPAAMTRVEPDPRYMAVPPEPTGSNGFAVAPQNTVDGKALLFINPHTSFFFREEAQVTSEEGLNAYGALTWGQFFIYQGFNERAGWMHTSSGVDNIDEFVLTTVTKDGTLFYKFGGEERPVATKTITVPYKTATGTAEKTFTVYRTHHGPVVREDGGKMIAVRLMEEPLKALDPVVQPHQGQEHRRVQAGDGGPHQLVERHALRRRRRQHRLLPLELRAQAQPEARLDQAGGRQRAGQRLAGRPRRGRQPERREPAERLGLQHQQLAVHRRRPLQQEEERLPRLLRPQRREPARHPRPARDGEQEGLHARRADRHRVRQPAARVRGAGAAAGAGLGPGAGLESAQGQAEGPVDLLRKWDHRWAADSVPQSLAYFWGEELWSKSADAARAAGVSVYEYLRTKATPQQRLEALSAAVDKLTADFGKWATPWGEINRFQRISPAIVHPFDDSKPSTAVGFTSARWGSLASFGARSYNGSKKIYGTSGNSFVAAVEFGKDGVRAKAVTAGGLSSDVNSKHFNDQAERYATGNLREVYFYPKQLEGHTERTYKPGQ